jgi:hypothetical protein
MKELPALLRPVIVPKEKYENMSFIEKLCLKASQGISFGLVFCWHLTQCKSDFNCTRNNKK